MARKEFFYGLIRYVVLLIYHSLYASTDLRRGLLGMINHAGDGGSGNICKTGNIADADVRRIVVE